jgi:hypothetical protein
VKRQRFEIPIFAPFQMPLIVDDDDDDDDDTKEM